MAQHRTSTGCAEVRELARARLRLQELAAQLEVAPFAPRTVELMRRHVEQDAEWGQRAFARWAALPVRVREQQAAALREEQR